MSLFKLCLFSSLVSLVVSIPSFKAPTLLHRRDFQYALPDGYIIDRTFGTGEIDQYYVYGGIIIAMLGLAYEDARNLTDPISMTYPTLTINITGAEVNSQYYRQFSSYTLYHALETIISDNDTRTSNFTLQNKAGAVACKVVLAPPSAEWQQLIGGSSGVLSPRSLHIPIPAIVDTRQTKLHNESAALEKLHPIYVSDWYGPEVNATDFFLALATLIVQVSDISDKDISINSQSVEDSGYHLNVTNVPSQSQRDYLTNRGVLNLASYACRELTERLDYGVDPITSFEATLLWTNGTDAIQQHVLRYEGSDRS